MHACDGSLMERRLSPVGLSFLTERQFGGSYPMPKCGVMPQIDEACIGLQGVVCNRRLGLPRPVSSSNLRPPQRPFGWTLGNPAHTFKTQIRWSRY